MYVNARIISCDIMRGNESLGPHYMLNLKTAYDNPILLVESDDFAFDVLDILDVKCWSQLPGTCLRLSLTDDNTLSAVGHCVDNNWLDHQDGWNFLHCGNDSEQSEARVGR